MVADREAELEDTIISWGTGGTKPHISGLAQIARPIRCSQNRRGPEAAERGEAGGTGK